MKLFNHLNLEQNKYVERNKNSRETYGIGSQITSKTIMLKLWPWYYSNE